MPNDQVPAPKLEVADLALLKTIVEQGDNIEPSEDLVQKIAAAQEAGSIETLGDDECYRLTQVLIHENWRIAESIRKLQKGADGDGTMRKAGEGRQTEIRDLVEKLSERREELRRAA